MTERLRERYGAQASVIEQAILEVVRELADVPASVRFGSLDEIGDSVLERARAQHPELADDVCRALGNYVAYGYR
jgi:hypothetical protein